MKRYLIILTLYLCAVVPMMAQYYSVNYDKRTERYLIILTLYLCAVVPMMAQYYSVNYDKRTVEALTAAFATEAATEADYAEQVAKIRDHYQAAEVAAAGIFTSKFLDRKALTHLGLWTSAT